MTITPYAMKRPLRSFRQERPLPRLLDLNSPPRSGVSSVGSMGFGVSREYAGGCASTSSIAFRVLGMRGTSWSFFVSSVSSKTIIGFRGQQEGRRPERRCTSYCSMSVRRIHGCNCAVAAECKMQGGRGNGLQKQKRLHPILVLIANFANGPELERSKFLRQSIHNARQTFSGEREHLLDPSS